MGEAVVVALVTGVLSIIGTGITVLSANSKTRSAMEVAQAETRKDIQYLADEVKRHNEFASRMPAVEEQIKALDHRVEALESKAS